MIIYWIKLQKGSREMMVQFNRSYDIFPESNQVMGKYQYIQRLQKLKSIGKIEHRKSASQGFEPKGKSSNVIKEILKKFKGNMQNKMSVSKSVNTFKDQKSQIDQYKLASKVAIFNKRSYSRKQRRNLIDHTKISSDKNSNLRKKFDQIIKNQENPKVRVIRPRSRMNGRHNIKSDSNNVTTNSGGWTGFKSGEGVTSDKSTAPALVRKLTGMSKSKYTDFNASRFDVISQSPTKTDKSLVIMDNMSNSKNNDLHEVYKILEKIEQTQFRNEYSHLRNRSSNTPKLSNEDKLTRNTKLSKNDKNHPMNLSVSSFNSAKHTYKKRPKRTPNENKRKKYIEYL